MVHRTFEYLRVVRSVSKDAYMGSDTGIEFDTYSWVTLCAHETMAQFVKYKCNDHAAMSVATIQFML